LEYRGVNNNYCKLLLTGYFADYQFSIANRLLNERLDGIGQFTRRRFMNARKAMQLGPQTRAIDKHGCCVGFAMRMIYACTADAVIVSSKSYRRHRRISILGKEARIAKY